MKRVYIGIIISVFLIPNLAFAQGFNRDLYYGMRNDSDVIKLQDFLRNLNLFNLPSSGNFFLATQSAVKKFQITNSITPNGYFGTKSRAVANKILGVNVNSPINTTTNTPTNNYVAPQNLFETKPQAPVDSPYKGKIFLSYVSGSSNKPEDEYATVDNRTNSDTINVTGWKISSTQSSMIIPRAQNLAGYSPSDQDPIILSGRGHVTINMGKQDKHMNFRINICTGYFSESSKFNSPLPTQCPRPDTKKLLFLSNDCFRVIDNTQSCRTVDPKLFLDPSCSVYVNKNMNYSGCVENNKDRTDFYASDWLVFMQRDSEFFRDIHDVVTLYDLEGKKVDEYSY